MYYFVTKIRIIGIVHYFLCIQFTVFTSEERIWWTNSAKPRSLNIFHHLHFPSVFHMNEICRVCWRCWTTIFALYASEKCELSTRLYFLFTVPMKRIGSMQKRFATTVGPSSWNKMELLGLLLTYTCENVYRRKRLHVALPAYASVSHLRSV